MKTVLIGIIFIALAMFLLDDYSKTRQKLQNQEEKIAKLEETIARTQRMLGIKKIEKCGNMYLPKK